MCLPSLVIWSGNADDMSEYIDDIYTRFLNTVIRGNLAYLNKPVKARWHPSHDDKHFSFWHVVSEQGQTTSEEDRNIDMRRCERIEWIGYCITTSLNTQKVLCWTNERGRRTRHLLYLHEERYIVVLEEREEFFLLITAYLVQHEHRHQKLLKEHISSQDPRNSSS